MEYCAIRGAAARLRVATSGDKREMTRRRKKKKEFTFLPEWISWEFDVVFPRGGLTLVVTTFCWEQDKRKKGHRGRVERQRTGFFFGWGVQNVSCVCEGFDTLRSYRGVEEAE